MDSLFHHNCGFVTEAYLSIQRRVTLTSLLLLRNFLECPAKICVYRSNFFAAVWDHLTATLIDVMVEQMKILDHRNLK